MAIKYLDQINVSNKKVLIRADFNVPYDKNMNITDDTRITSTLPTIEYCLKQNATVILVSHLGRPKGKPVPEMSLKPVAKRLSELLKKDVVFIDKPITQGIQDEINKLKPGDVALLENIRFYPEEEKNDENFGKLLGALADVYVNDAFATAHRGHASNEAITRYVKECVAGFLMKDELEYFKKALVQPQKPVTAIIGGVKISTKIDVLKNIIPKVDNLLIGGGMSYTFLKALGYNIGKSVVEDDQLHTAKEIIELAKKHNVNLLLPEDIVVANKFDSPEGKEVVPITSIPDNKEGVDIGPATRKKFAEIIKQSKTVIWNGPLGAFETKEFAEGTGEIAKVVAESGCTSVIGGGDTGAAINSSGYADKMTYISTAGGAFLELMEGKILPAVKALDK
ncbi:MAG TPA: phosphoglycerate kinase [Spirochaetota bacterium]|nr:phosphoglycerate kinase [Spirochaetota bacterium]HPP48739.1 phosphoglycerate kinase [Spirochaetota bacterium]